MNKAEFQTQVTSYPPQEGLYEIGVTFKSGITKWYDNVDLLSHWITEPGQTAQSCCAQFALWQAHLRGDVGEPLHARITRFQIGDTNDKEQQVEEAFEKVRHLRKSSPDLVKRHALYSWEAHGYFAATGLTSMKYTEICLTASTGRRLYDALMAYTRGRENEHCRVNRIDLLAIKSPETSTSMYEIEYHHYGAVYRESGVALEQYGKENGISGGAHPLRVIAIEYLRDTISSITRASSVQIVKVTKTHEVPRIGHSLITMEDLMADLKAPEPEAPKTEALPQVWSIEYTVKRSAIYSRTDAGIDLEGFAKRAGLNNKNILYKAKQWLLNNKPFTAKEREALLVIRVFGTEPYVPAAKPVFKGVSFVKLEPVPVDFGLAWTEPIVKNLRRAYPMFDWLHSSTKEIGRIVGKSQSFHVEATEKIMWLCVGPEEHQVFEAARYEGKPHDFDSIRFAMEQGFDVVRRARAMEEPVYPVRVRFPPTAEPLVKGPCSKCHDGQIVTYTGLEVVETEPCPICNLQVRLA